MSNFDISSESNCFNFCDDITDTDFLNERLEINVSSALTGTFFVNSG